MRSIYVIDDNNNYTMHWLMALLWANKQFNERGYSIQFHNGETLISRRLKTKPFVLNDLKAIVENKKQYDVVFLAFHWVRPFFDSSDEDIISVLCKLREKCNVLIWLDTADSTGTPKFQFLPYVDRYLKKQLLKDKRRYFGPIWGGKVHVEYYHNLLGIDDPEVHKSESFYPLQKEEDQEKLGVSWNVGCGYFRKGSLATQLFHPFDFAKTYTFIPPEASRCYDIHFRGSAWSPLAGYQRTMTIKYLKENPDIKSPDATKKVPFKEYNDELKQSRMVCSPFGWGEICGRDFETFLYGATLIKPSMEHIETFPEWYIPNKTYISIKWDFSDFQDVIENIRKKTIKRYQQIAINGQELFRRTMMTENGQKEFVKHVIDEIDKSIR